MDEEKYHADDRWRVQNSREGLAEGSERRWDLVILDVSLPDRDEFSP